MKGKRGLGIDEGSSKLISPCPRMIDVYFRNQLKYSKTSPDNPNCKDPFYVKYIKTLNHADNPLFADLRNINCTSSIIVDMYTGKIVDHYLKINNGSAIRSFADCPDLGHLVYVFKYHLNLVHMSKEYIKGGWMHRASIEAEIKNAQDKYVFLTRAGFTNIIEKAKPEDEGE